MVDGQGLGSQVGSPWPQCSADRQAHFGKPELIRWVVPPSALPSPLSPCRVPSWPALSLAQGCGPPQPLLSGPPASRGFAGSPAAVAVPSWALGLLPVPSGGCGVGGAMLISHTFGPSTGDSSGVLRAQILVSEASIWTGPLSKMAPMML